MTSNPSKAGLPRKSGSILPLSSEAISQIHSSKHITSLQGVVIGLLENSLDAGSSKIEVSLDFAKGNCSVEDNGSGIASAEFLEDGGLAKLYRTSKREGVQSPNLHGGTGTFLASLSALCLLSIDSRRREDECATLTLHQSRIIARRCPALQSRELIGTNGTMVSVNDLFGSIPVRVKQRALHNDTGGIDEKAWRDLKHDIVALLLAWPKPCFIRLNNINAPSKPISLFTAHVNKYSILTERSLNRLQGAVGAFDIRDALSVAFQAGFAPQETRSHWEPVSATTDRLSVKGLICRSPAPSRAVQFISVGVHPISSGDGHGVLYDEINKVFVDSDFGAVDDVAMGNDSEKHGRTRRQLIGRKAVDRHAMFVFKVSLHLRREQSVATSHLGEASLQAIVGVLKTTVSHWLKAHHFRPRDRARQGMLQQPDAQANIVHQPVPPATTPDCHTEAGTRPYKRPRVTVPSTRSVHGSALPDRPTSSWSLNSWSRIKSGRREFFEDLDSMSKPLTAPAVTQSADAHSSASIAVGSASSMLETRPRQSFADSAIVQAKSHRPSSSSDLLGGVSDSEVLEALGARGQSPGIYGHIAPDQRSGSRADMDGENADECDDQTFQWLNQSNNQSYRVNVRTGIVMPTKRRSGTGLKAPAILDTALSSTGRPLSMRRRTAPAQPHSSTGWLSGFLQDWKNPVFARPREERIAVAPTNIPAVTPTDGLSCEHGVLGHMPGGINVPIHRKLSRAGLAKATIIDQVDKKFILCSATCIDDANARTLVLVDQHAASERVILEQLLSELCLPLPNQSPEASIRTDTGCASAIQTMVLDRPLLFEVDSREHKLLSTHASRFARWGILYDLPSHVSIPTASQVRQPRTQFQLSVRTLPPAIAERCRLLPQLLIDLIRTEIWRLSNSDTGPISTRVPTHGDISEPHPWLRDLGTCPKGIIDMLNSRACRSAVMFNDVLSRQECVDLMARLASCAFPFMCAHGRTSVVPVISLGAGETGDGLDLSGVGNDVLKETTSCKERSFAESFKRWKRSESTV